ncbi:cbb3-type cytochrome oxidase assembly protein CcoS [Ekhidna sp.]|uniref:cbb3-type cytochrome oxidase assembly protein CcoS n=1 Tax=Ekhidna sp. TaxID=2608089 RepID=UPI003CCC17D9
MSVIFILIACSLLLAGSFLAAFLWASRSGQFEDDYTPSVRILFDEEGPSVQTNSKSSNKSSDQCQKTTKK